MTVWKQKLTSIFHLSTRPRVTIARARNEGNQSEVENYVGVFIDYGLTGPRVRAGIARLQCAERGNGGEGERGRERERARILTADEGADLRFEIRARNKHEKIITIKTAVSARDVRCRAYTFLDWPKWSRIHGLENSNESYAGGNGGIYVFMQNIAPVAIIRDIVCINKVKSRRVTIISPSIDDSSVDHNLKKTLQNKFL